MRKLTRRDFGKTLAATSLGPWAVRYSSFPISSRIAEADSLPVSSSEVQHEPDLVLKDIADYVDHFEIKSETAYSNARLSLMDSLGCGFEALEFPACTKLLGPVAIGTVVPNGARVPGTDLELDPVTAAFNISCIVRWLDFSDATPTGPEGAHGGHPSDGLGGILASADYLSRTRLSEGKAPLVMRDVLTAMIKSYEIQGGLGLDQSVHRAGIDNVGLVKVATAAVVTKMLGGTWSEIVAATSQAWIDLTSIVIYRQPHYLGSRKSWAGGDASSRGTWLALITLRGEEGYPSALTAKKSGLYDVLYNGQPFKLLHPYGSYVMENVLYKVSYPADFGGQSALECAVKLHPLVKDRLNDVAKITLTTQQDAVRDNANNGPLANPAARDHNLQYMTAVGLIFGNLTAKDYDDSVAADPRIDALRSKMVVVQDKQYVADANDPSKQSSANAIQIQFKDGSQTPKVEVQYPIGHPRRRAEAIPLLNEKFKTNLARKFPSKRQDKILALCLDQKQLEAVPVSEFMELFVT